MKKAGWGVQLNMKKAGWGVQLNRCLTYGKRENKIREKS